MRKFLVVLTALFVIGIVNPLLQAQAEEASSSRGEEVNVEVMSYNIHHGVGEDNVLDLERIAAIIEDSEADIIGLQEVDNHWSSRSDFENQAKWLAERLDMFYVYAANLDREPLNEGEPRRQYGTAVLSKYPILEWENHPLTKIDYPDRYSEQRGLLEVKINVKGAHLYFYNTHLGLTSEQRDIQIQEIAEISAQKEGPKVILGDLNAVPESSEMKHVLSEYKDTFADQSTSYTYPSENPRKRIDYILTSEDIEVTDAEVIQTLASDHLPLTANLVLDRLGAYVNSSNK